MKFAATCGTGLEPALEAELTALGLSGVEAGHRVVHFEGDLEAGYRACLWSRVASRVLLFLRRCFAGSADALYAELRKIPWFEHLGKDSTLAVTFVGTNEAIIHTGFGAQKTKDAVVDSLRDDRGNRPGVDLHAPDVRIHVALQGTRALVSIDLSGDPLHLRGFDRDGGDAPLKETLAAGILWHAGFAEGEGPIVDPMCGSGTFLVEAAGMRAHVAPGRHRPRWGFSGWRGHDEGLWRRLLEEAADRERPLPAGLIFGGDHNQAQQRRSEYNLRRAGFGEEVAVAKRELCDWRPPMEGTGFVVTNPPYGERMGSTQEVTATWRELGDVLRRHFLGWDAWLLAGQPPLAKKLGLRPKRRIPIFNGPLEGRLLHVPIADRPPARLQ